MKRIRILWDVVVTIGCGDDCPAVRATRRLNWAVPDPKGKLLDEYRRIRDMIQGSVAGLLDEVRAASRPTTTMLL